MLSEKKSMRNKWIQGLTALAITFGASFPSLSDDSTLSATEIVAKAHSAAGGDIWLRPTTLSLVGHGTFWGQDGKTIIADDYRMWRVFNAERKVAHGPSGLVRIDSKIGDAFMFQVSFDGENTWTDKGLVPVEQAKTYWSNAFGFGVIRHALDDGYEVSLKPSDQIRSVDAHMVMVTDPTGGETLFGIAKNDYRILMVGFNTPRGWHVRHYSKFETLENGWVQPGVVTLYYDGVKSNEIEWTGTEVNTPLPQSHFILDTSNSEGDQK